MEYRYGKIASDATDLIIKFEDGSSDIKYTALAVTMTLKKLREKYLSEYQNFSFKPGRDYDQLSNSSESTIRLANLGDYQGSKLLFMEKTENVPSYQRSKNDYLFGNLNTKNISQNTYGRSITSTQLPNESIVTSQTSNEEEFSLQNVQIELLNRKKHTYFGDPQNNYKKVENPEDGEERYLLKVNVIDPNGEKYPATIFQKRALILMNNMFPPEFSSLTSHQLELVKSYILKQRYNVDLKRDPNDSFSDWYIVTDIKLSITSQND